MASTIPHTAGAHRTEQHGARRRFCGTPFVWACRRPVVGAGRLPSSGAPRELRVVLEPQPNQGVRLNGDDCGASEMLACETFRDLMAVRDWRRTSVGCQVSEASFRWGTEELCEAGVRVVRTVAGDLAYEPARLARAGAAD